MDYIQYLHHWECDRFEVNVFFKRKDVNIRNGKLQRKELTLSILHSVIQLTTHLNVLSDGDATVM